MVSTPHESEEIPTQLRITDQALIRKVVALQLSEGDKTPTRTAGKIIERYFTMTGANVRPAEPGMLEQPRQAAGSTH